MVDVGDETTYDWDWDHHSMDGGLDRFVGKKTCPSHLLYSDVVCLWLKHVVPIDTHIS